MANNDAVTNSNPVTSEVSTMVSTPVALKAKTAIFVARSKNEKTGPVSVTYASIDGSCPKDCMHRDAGCYAQTGMVGIQTNRLNKNNKTRGRSDAREIAREEARYIRAAIANGENTQAMRLHVAGDCRTASAARTVSSACEGWNNPVWTYTHAWKVVDRENWGNVSVLASVDKSEDISLAFERGYAPAIVVSEHPTDGKSFVRAEDNIRIIPCPAQTRENVTCDTCKLCWNAARLHATRSAISFAAHGVRKRKLTVIR